MIIINPGSKTGGGTEAQALENARQWLCDMRANGITDPNVVLVEEPVEFDELRWTFTFRHLLTGVECELSIHGLTEDEADAFMFRPRVYWNGSSCSTPDPLDWMSPGYVLAVVPASLLSDCPACGGLLTKLEDEERAEIGVSCVECDFLHYDGEPWPAPYP